MKPTICGDNAIYVPSQEPCTDCERFEHRLDEAEEDIVAVGQEVNALNTYLNNRIDNIIAGPAPSAEEIVDARIGADGTTYASLGSAVRGQVADLEGEIDRTRKHTKNLFNPNNVMNAYFATGKITAKSDTRFVWIPCKPSTTYTVSKTAGTRFTVGYTDETPAVGMTVSGIKTKSTSSKINITTGESAQYLLSWVYNGATDTDITADEMLASVQIEEGSSATAYMPPFTAEDLYAHHSLGALADGTNLNDVPNDNGFYYLPYGGTYVNDPIGRKTRRVLFVYSFNNTDTYYLQKMMNFTDGSSFVRYHTGDSGWSDWVSSSESDASDADDKVYQLTMRRNAHNSEYASLPKVLNLLHFSDLHHHQSNLRDVINIGKQYSSLIDDIICTGDMVDYWADGDMSFWTNDDDATNIMTVIGNHDAKAERASSKPNYQKYTMAECRLMYMSNLPSWGVVAPSDATYYYKDYLDAEIRLIVLDATLRDSDATGQLSWLTDILADAKLNDLSVVIAEHYEPQNPTLIQSDFTNDVHSPLTATWFSFDEAYQEVVQRFIEGDGEFICYIAGHQHTDYVCYNANYPDQPFFVVTCAYPDMRFTDQMRTEGTPTETCCNMIAFDTTTKAIKVLRFGAKSDYLLRPREYLVYNYQTKTIVRQASGTSN